jgi:hypothetical protein
MKLIALPLLLLGLTACAPHLYDSMESYMLSKRLEQPKPERFANCQAYGCAIVMNVELNKHDWKKIEKAYGKKAKTAEEEREKIARTIGVFEQIVGPITGTQDDRPGTFEKTGRGQQDCVDESTNASVYMMLLDQKELIKFHTIEQPQVRYPLVSGRGWMHQTAVIRETKTGEEFAIDSWFEENGVKAHVVSMKEWMEGWTPDNLAKADEAKLTPAKASAKKVKKPAKETKPQAK